MQLKLEKLQKVASKAMSEEKRSEAFKAEVRSAIGPNVLVTHGLKLMAESANNQLDILERTGRAANGVRTALLLQFVNSDIAEVRKLVARLLPESFVRKLMFDPKGMVRAAAAERLSLAHVQEMSKRFPSDDHLRSVVNKKALLEAGLPKPAPAEKELDVYGEFPLSDAYDGVEHPGFTDEWYNTQAHKIINGPTAYGNNLESNWEEKSVKRFCDSYKSQNIEIDNKKLLDSVYKHMDVRDQAAIKNSKIGSSDLDESVFKKLTKQLRFESTYNPIVLEFSEEKTDLVDDLLERKLTSSDFISRFEELFVVEKGPVENPGKSIGINESFSRVVVPVSALLPGNAPRASDEKAIGTYVKHWNFRREMKNQPYKLSWQPSGNGKITFKLGLL